MYRSSKKNIDFQIGLQRRANLGFKRKILKENQVELFNTFPNRAH